MRHSGHILLESLPNGLSVDNVKHDLELVANTSPIRPVVKHKLTITTDPWCPSHPRAAYLATQSTKSPSIRPRCCLRAHNTRIPENSENHERMFSRIRDPFGDAAARDYAAYPCEGGSGV